MLVTAVESVKRTAPTAFAKSTAAEIKELAMPSNNGVNASRLAAFVHEGNFNDLQSAHSRLLVAVTRPARTLGLAGSVVAGSLAYLVDKKLFHRIHPTLPRFLGLKQAFFALQDCTTTQEVQNTLRAAAAAPPFMSGIRLHGEWAFDGGYTDNAPIPAQTATEKASTLVLLTRHYPEKPALFQMDGRIYWQPSQPVPVSTWDCRPGTTVEDTFALGQQDAQLALTKAGSNHSSEPKISLT